MSITIYLLGNCHNVFLLDEMVTMFWLENCYDVFARGNCHDVLAGGFLPSNEVTMAYGRQLMSDLMTTFTISRVS